MNITNNVAEQQAQIITQIQQLVKEISKCAPHPDRPDHKGPVFLKSDPNYKLPAEYDGSLGSLMMENMLGLEFATAASETASSWLKYSNESMEMASAYVQDRPNSTPFALGQTNRIANDFNMIGSRSQEYQNMMNAYLADLPDRVRLETWLSHETRRLYALWKNAPPAPRMVA